MFRMNAAALRTTLEQLEQGTRDHREWREGIGRTIVCGLPCEPAELSADAHRQCALGRWYYSEAADGLRNDRILASMEAQHERVHAIGVVIMRKYHGRQPILPSEFDEYLAASDGLRRELGAILQEIRDILHGSDALTGAFGRALLLPDLRQWHALATRDVQQCCIAFVDIDQLKEINDVHGHTVGDQVLAGAIAQLTRHLRPYDRVYRYGGDEFVMSLPATELEQAEQLLVRLRDAIVGEPLVVPPAGDPVYASASFGLAMLDPEISVEEAVDRADRALLLAKSSGRNRVVSWEPGIRTGTMLAWRNEDSACK